METKSIDVKQPDDLNDEAKIRCECIRKIVEIQEFCEEIKFALLRKEDIRTKHPFRQIKKYIRLIEHNLKDLLGDYYSEQELSKAEKIVWALKYGGNIEDWRSRLPNRPDWQHLIRFVEEIISS